MMLILLLATSLLAQLQLLFLYTKSLNNLILKDEVSNKLETAALKLSNISTSKLFNKSSCMITKLNSTTPLAYLAKINSACSLKENQIKIFYLIEDLGAFDCLIIRRKDKNYSSNHWRLTLMTESKLSKTHYVFLQLRMAAAQSTLNCQLNTSFRKIKPGIISWSYLE